MASDLSAYFGNKIVRYLQGNALPTPPTQLYIAIFNGNPKTSGTEIGATVNSGTPRQPVSFATVASGAAHLLTSNVAVDFGNAEGAASLTHVALFDNATPGSGNLYASKQVPGGNASILIGSSVKFQSGGITFNVGADS